MVQLFIECIHSRYLHATIRMFKLGFTLSRINIQLIITKTYLSLLPLTTTKIVFNLFRGPIRLLILGMKWVSNHYDLQMFGLKLNDCDMSNFNPLEVEARHNFEWGDFFFQLKI